MLDLTLIYQAYKTQQGPLRHNKSTKAHTSHSLLNFMSHHRQHVISYQKQVTGQSHNFVVSKNKQVIDLKMENDNNE